MDDPRTPAQVAEEERQKAHSTGIDLVVHVGLGLPTTEPEHTAALELGKRLVDEHRAAINRAVLARAWATADRMLFAWASAVSQGQSMAEVLEAERDRLRRAYEEATK